MFPNRYVTTGEQAQHDVRTASLGSFQFEYIDRTNRMHGLCKFTDHFQSHLNSIFHHYTVEAQWWGISSDSFNPSVLFSNEFVCSTKDLTDYSIPSILH